MITYRTQCRRVMKYAEAGCDNCGWYRDARVVLWHIAHREGWDCHRWMDVIAILSPRRSVKRNLRVAYQFMSVGTLPLDVTKGHAESLTHYEMTGEIRGPKTSTFAQVLKGNDDLVVVDSWMLRSIGAPDQPRVASRAAVDKVVRSVARSVGWSPVEAQAAIWAGAILSHNHGRAIKIPRYRLEDLNMKGDT